MDRKAPREGQTESVGPPHRDDDPPRRGPLPFVWIAVTVVGAVAIAVLLIALAAGLVG